MFQLLQVSVIFSFYIFIGSSQFSVITGGSSETSWASTLFEIPIIKTNSGNKTKFIFVYQFSTCFCLKLTMSIKP